MLHLLFDLDGTLTDPALGIVTCIQHALRELAAPVWSEAELVRFIGPPLKDSFEEILGTRDPTTLERAVQLYRERFSAQGIFENKLHDGIPEALAALDAAGFPMWVVTSKVEIYAVRIVEHFGLSPHFRKVYGAELSGERSVKSELIAHVLSEEQIEPSNACMIGDRKHDIAGAKANLGVRSLGVLWGYGSRDELELAGADGIVARVADLVAAVRGL